MAETRRGACVVIGAGDGLGASVARAFAREGLAAILTRRPRHLDALQALARTIRAEGGEAHAFGLDARQEAEVVAFFDRSSGPSGRSKFWSSTSAPTCAFRSSRRRRRSIPRCGRWRPSPAFSRVARRRG